MSIDHFATNGVVTPDASTATQNAPETPPSAAYHDLLTQNAAYDVWTQLTPNNQLHILRTHFTDPNVWLEPEYLELLARYRHDPPGVWGQLRLRYKAIGGIVYDLQSAVDALLMVNEALPAASAGACWTLGLTAADFLAQDDAEVTADAKDLVVPGCITLLAAPRSSGKSLVALYLAVALARGAVFRGQRVPKRRVALIDRDNPPALVRKRLRWLGADDVTDLTVFTRDIAPPLTDAKTWDAFPVDEFDVVIVDSIGAATEGVSEKEGKQTQQYLATLKDLARRGPAVLALDNTNKAATNYRGRGEKADAVDILYEARNITGWTPSKGGDWWEDLPDFGEHTWQERVSRRKGQPVLHIAFIPSKYRLGIEPEPFVLAIDTTQDPWTLDDITEDITRAGEEAAEAAHQQARATIQAAELALVTALATRSADTPLLKCEAESILCAQGLRQKVARTLLMTGGNRDVYPEGRWVLRAIPGARGKAIGVYLPGEKDRNENTPPVGSPQQHAGATPVISVDGSTPCNENADSSIARKIADEMSNLFSLPHGCDMTKIDRGFSKQPRGSQDEGICVVNAMHSGIPEEPCIHEHVNTNGYCEDCGVRVNAGKGE
jgi:hypothetical protein